MSKTTFWYKETKLFYFPFLMLFLFSFITNAQTKISGIVNSYTAVTGVNLPVCNVCDLNCTHTITVADASKLAVGDKALIIQMKGATINTNNSAAGGSITAINDAGNYEFFEIASIVGNVLTPRYPLIKRYNVAGLVQVVTIPKYTGTVTIDGTLTAKDWTDATKTGGVLAISADKLVFNANIDVAGKGYEGIKMETDALSNFDNCNTNPNTQFVLPSSNGGSFTKGDGIVIDDALTERGRAPRANGGGAGVAGDSGGGGGSNYGAGGAGGNRWCEFASAAGGVGGVALASFLPNDKVFLGGAGGTGFVTTGNPSSAADGGGIVIVFANEIIGNGYKIIADGLSPTPVTVQGNPDGGGGGGAGGTVVLKTPKFTTSLVVSAKGGDGQDIGTIVKHGPGGGGGGGALLYSLASLPSNVTLQASGGTGGQHDDASRNGSQDGAIGGTISLYIPVENPNYVGNNDTDNVPENCDLDDDNDGILDTVEHAGLPDPFAFTGSSKTPNYFNPLVSGFVDTNADGIDDRYDTDLDGIINQLDLDSDNDGCSDANEYYNSKTTDGGDGGVFGVGTPTVDATGKVNGPVAAPYSGSYTNVIIPFKLTNPSTQTTTVGGNVTFSVTVSGGTGSTTYQWQESTNGGTNWSNIVNGGIYADANTASLKLTGVTLAMKNNKYRVLVGDTNYVCELVTASGVLSYSNSAPVAVDDVYTVLKEGTVTLLPLDLDTDVDGDILSITSINGTLLTSGIAQEISVTNGKVNVTVAGVITFTPSSNYIGSVSFSYVINDGKGGSATAKENITVKAVNVAPIAENNAYSGLEDAVSIIGNVITDIDATAGLDADID
ncbi:Ig-like domain-containing protein, partial [Flavobacterium succinicans]|uniref:Ig-like domain-containing protein n=1 Tax=Flavobacterium succinicans TaxID=29536 RepID=UPI000AD3AB7B